jgi:quercetin dioxygenase-like cupin family protein
MSEFPVTPIMLAPGLGVSVQNPVGGVLTFKATSDQSGGALTAIETAAAPGEGPPLHVHRDEDEFILTLGSGLRIKVADRLMDAPAGTFVFVPRGTPHTWQNVGGAPTRFFAALVPAATGFEQFFARYAELPPGERGHDAFARLGRETQALEVVGPPLAKSDPM